jgi:phosphohistidine phosphatase
MNLFFLRHGKACARSRKWRPDGTRPLTRDGEKKMFEVARGLLTLDVSFDLVLTSPYIRAFRTAEIVGEVFESKKVFETRNLIPTAEPKAIIDEIRKNFSSLKQVVLVGHEPFMSNLISILLCGTNTMAVELRKGGCCQLNIERLSFGRCASLDWLMTPRQMARLRRGK